jgi:hypothetical protein
LRAEVEASVQKALSLTSSQAENLYQVLQLDQKRKSEATFSHLSSWQRQLKWDETWVLLDRDLQSFLTPAQFAQWQKLNRPPFFIVRLAGWPDILMPGPSPEIAFRKQRKEFSKAEAK